MTAVKEALVLRCPYCEGKGTLQPGDLVWPKKGFPPLYVCENFPRCDSFVRCHEGTEIPLGTMARKRLRSLRKTAHDAFDPIWKDSGNELGRTAAYEVAAKVMGVDGEFHIGNLDEVRCEEFIKLMPLIEMEMDKRLDEHASRGAPPSEITIEVLHALFHPDRDTFLPYIELNAILSYDRAWQDAQRCGLVIQDRFVVKLSPRGVDLVFQPTD